MGVRALTGIFNVQSWKMRKEFAKKIIWWLWQNPEFMLFNIFSPSCTKFGDFSLENETSNAKRAWLIKGSIMCIFNEAEPQ